MPPVLPVVPRSTVRAPVVTLVPMVDELTVSRISYGGGLHSVDKTEGLADGVTGP
jgi:hypothetical protein